MYYKKEYIYIVCDYATNGILLTTKNVVLANSLSAGILNTFVKAYLPENSNTGVLMMLDNVAKFYYLKEPTIIGEMIESSVTQDFVNRKKLIQRRKGLMSFWVQVCKLTYDRQKITIDPSVEILLDNELSKCTDTPTNIIYELADIHGVDVQTYIDDVKLRLDSARNAKLRVSAIFDKYRDKLNNLTESEGLRQAYRDGVAELVTNAYI